MACGSHAATSKVLENEWHTRIETRVRARATRPAVISCAPRVVPQGDPALAPYAVETAKAILGKRPVFGICMGHQILGQAFGGSTFKLPFGHHGGNHPIRDAATGRIQISAQNHNYAIDPATLPDGVTVSHVNLNDGARRAQLLPCESVGGSCRIFRPRL